MLTEEELNALSEVSKMHKAILKTFGSDNKDDVKELLFHTHALQNMIMANCAARCYPEHFRLNGHE